MKKNILVVIVVGAYLATLGNLVWETWDYGLPSDLPKPNPGSDSDKEIGDHLKRYGNFSSLFVLAGGEKSF